MNPKYNDAKRSLQIETFGYKYINDGSNLMEN
jgi:hypothetical protein